MDNSFTLILNKGTASLFLKYGNCWHELLPDDAEPLIDSILNFRGKRNIKEIENALKPTAPWKVGFEQDHIMISCRQANNEDGKDEWCKHRAGLAYLHKSAVGLAFDLAKYKEERGAFLIQRWDDMSLRKEAITLYQRSIFHCVAVGCNFNQSTGWVNKFAFDARLELSLLLHNTCSSLTLRLPSFERLIWDSIKPHKEYFSSDLSEQFMENLVLGSFSDRMFVSKYYEGKVDFSGRDLFFRKFSEYLHPERFFWLDDKAREEFYIKGTDRHVALPDKTALDHLICSLYYYGKAYFYRDHSAAWNGADIQLYRGLGRVCYFASLISKEFKETFRKEGIKFLGIACALKEGDEDFEASIIVTYLRCVQYSKDADYESLKKLYLRHPEWNHTLGYIKKPASDLLYGKGLIQVSEKYTPEPKESSLGEEEGLAVGVSYINKARAFFKQGTFGNEEARDHASALLAKAKSSLGPLSGKEAEVRWMEVIGLLSIIESERNSASGTFSMNLHEIQIILNFFEALGGLHHSENFDPELLATIAYHRVKQFNADIAAYIRDDSLKNQVGEHHELWRQSSTAIFRSGIQNLMKALALSTGIELVYKDKLIAYVCYASLLRENALSVDAYDRRATLMNLDAVCSFAESRSESVRLLARCSSAILSCKYSDDDSTKQKALSFLRDESTVEKLKELRSKVSRDVEISSVDESVLSHAFNELYQLFDQLKLA